PPGGHDGDASRPRVSQQAQAHPLPDQGGRRVSTAYPPRDWLPPRDMPPAVVAAWRAFYRKAWQAYGITPHQYRALYLAQLGRCYICQEAKGMHPDDPKGGGGKRLAVDHNHLMRGVSSVRGLL